MTYIMIYELETYNLLVVTIKALRMLLKNNSRLIEIGGNIRKWRLIRGMMQEALADELDISTVAISKIENGKTDIPLNRLFDIATVLDIKVESLFKDPYRVFSNYSDVDSKL